MNRQRRMRRVQRGFTLGEMITTVAIVGTVAAIAVPGYLKIRQNANMEMVRQQMRAIAEKMTEILGKHNQFPDPAAWPFDTSADPDEMSVSASLSAIDSYCYTTNKSDYVVDDTRTAYSFCTKPKAGGCGGTAGSKRFCIHFSPEMSQYFAPGIVGEVSMTDPLGQYHATNAWDLLTIENVFDAFLYERNQTLDPSQITDYFAATLQKGAENNLFLAKNQASDIYEEYYSTVFAFDDSNGSGDFVDQLLSNTFSKFRSEGYEMYFNDISFEQFNKEYNSNNLCAEEGMGCSNPISGLVNLHSESNRFVHVTVFSTNDVAQDLQELQARYDSIGPGIMDWYAAQEGAV